MTKPNKKSNTNNATNNRPTKNGTNRPNLLMRKIGASIHKYRQTQLAVHNLIHGNIGVVDFTLGLLLQIFETFIRDGLYCIAICTILGLDYTLYVGLYMAVRVGFMLYNLVKSFINEAFGLRLVSEK